MRGESARIVCYNLGLGTEMGGEREENDYAKCRRAKLDGRNVAENVSKRLYIKARLYGVEYKTERDDFVEFYKERPTFLFFFLST